MQAILPGTTYERIHPDEKDLSPEEQTIFVFKHLTIEQDNYIAPKMEKIKPGTELKTVNNFMLSYMDLGFVGVRNFKSEGEEITIERNTEAKELPGGVYPWKRKDIEMFQKHVRNWIYSTIMQDGRIEETEAKNS